MLAILTLADGRAVFAKSIECDTDRVFGPVLNDEQEARAFATYLKCHGLEPETDLTDRGLSYRLMAFREEQASHEARLSQLIGGRG